LIELYQKEPCQNTRVYHHWRYIFNDIKNGQNRFFGLFLSILTNNYVSKQEIWVARLFFTYMYIDSKILSKPALISTLQKSFLI